MSDKEYHRNYYHTRVDKDKKQRLKKERAARIQEYIDSYLLEHPCVDCGENDVLVLDFDHVRGKKTKSICDAMRFGWSLVRIKEEINKCEVRCANCHRRKTAKQLNWRRTKL